MWYCARRSSRKHKQLVHITHTSMPCITPASGGFSSVCSIMHFTMRALLTSRLRRQPVGGWLRKGSGPLFTSQTIPVLAEHGVRSCADLRPGAGGGVADQRQRCLRVVLVGDRKRSMRTSEGGILEPTPFFSRQTRHVTPPRSQVVAALSEPLSPRKHTGFHAACAIHSDAPARSACPGSAP
jgi:hypothetical protein